MISVSLMYIFLSLKFKIMFMKIVSTIKLRAVALHSIMIMWRHWTDSSGTSLGHFDERWI